GRRAASAMFMLGRVFASGARLFIVALPSTLIVFGEPAGGEVPASQLVLAIGAMTIVGILYTLVGGISSVIWSDVIQTGVFLAAVIGAITLLLMRIPVGPAEIAQVLSGSPGATPGSSKLTVISLSTDPGAAYTLWSVVIGFTLLGIASYGTDQDLVQRMLTCKNAKAGSWSVISAQLMGIPVVLLFMAVGLLLYVFYARPDVMGASMPSDSPDDSRTVFLSFILREMPAGMSGLMMAGLFAAGLSSLNSAINAMSSTLVSDFYRPMRAGMPERHYVLVGRAAVVGWGLVLGSFACFCVYWQRASGQTLIDFALSVMTFAYAGLLGVFFCVLFTKRGSTLSVIGALVVGFVVILVQQPMVWGWGAFVALDARVGVDLSLAASLAFPWKLSIGAALAFGVALLGSPRAGAQAERAAPTAAR
ncbi:MAG: sodium:solute symporter, partial [Planctomycetota bacterium]